jgi:UDP-glucose 4-epimerase
MRVVLTGGAGYIGSHTAVELLGLGHDVVILDNLANAKRAAVARIEELAGRAPSFHEVDLRDREGMRSVFAEAPVDAVVHFAGLKAVGESVEQPLRYYDNNVAGTVVLLEAMREAGVRDLVFSSSCTVYGEPDRVPIDESAALRAASPYGRSKLFIEEIMRDLAASEPGWRLLLLRYFNPVGAHSSGRMGEDPWGRPNNLMPFVMQVAVGRLPALQVFGGDYPTPDGTGVRDYIHVADLAQGHVAALEALPKVEGCQPVNLGTGRGHSVLEVLAAAEAAVGRPIPHEIVARRPGDVAAVWADPTLGTALLGWAAQRDLDEMCRDAWRWQSENPDGYPG